MLVLSTFKDNLLIFNQLNNLSMPCFILFSKCIIYLSLKIKVVSSANKIGLKTGDIFCRSFIYNKNKIEPNTDPCGTQQLILFRLDLISL